jgi:hypothetical protein
MKAIYGFITRRRDAVLSAVEMISKRIHLATQKQSEVVVRPCLIVLELESHEDGEFVLARRCEWARESR